MGETIPANNLFVNYGVGINGSAKTGPATAENVAIPNYPSPTGDVAEIKACMAGTLATSPTPTLAGSAPNSFPDVGKLVANPKYASTIANAANLFNQHGKEIRIAAAATAPTPDHEVG